MWRPGLGNAMGSLFNAKFTGTPMILTAGQQEQGHGLTEPLLYAPLVPIAEPMVKWAVEVTRLEDLPRIVRRAAKVAMTPPTGPVFISLPGDILNAEAGLELGASTRVDTRSRPPMRCSTGWPSACSRPSAPSSSSATRSSRAMRWRRRPPSRRRWARPSISKAPPTARISSRSMPATPAGFPATRSRCAALLSKYDLLVVLGADPVRMSVWSEVEPLPDGLPVVHIGLIDWDMGKNFAAEMAVRADVRETLLALTPLLARQGGERLAARAKAAMAELAKSNWTAKRADLTARIEGRAKATPIDPDWLTLQVAKALPRDAVVVNESLTAGRHLTDLVPYRDRYGFHALAAGGIGWGVPAAVGVALAQAPRPVLCYSGDGSAMYTIQALWTAAHLKLPITYVIANNGGYRILKQRLKAFHGNDEPIGMDLVDPKVDFVGLAKAMGMAAERIAEPEALAPALQRAFASPGPKLLDVVVDGRY